MGLFFYLFLMNFKKSLFKFKSINLFHKFKKYKFTKYKGFLSKKILSYSVKKIYFVFNIRILDFCRYNILLINNNLNKISNYKVHHSLFFQKNDESQEILLIRLLIMKNRFINNKYFVKKKNLSVIYQFLKQKQKKKSLRNNLAIKKTHNVNFLSENPTISKNLKFIKEKTKTTRKDFRKYEMFSIDPLGTLNFEDCIHFKFKKKYSRYELGIHISDISSFLSIEKQHIIKSIEKVSSCFLHNKKVNLFSILSSNNLYSFRPWIDRFSFSLIFRLDHSSNVLYLYICKSIVRNKRSFSKLQFCEIVSQFNKKTNNKTCLFGKNLTKILEMKKKLNSNRIKLNGKFQLKLGQIVRNFNSYNKNQKNDIIEEFMLLFNVCLTEKILEYFPSCSNIEKFSKNSKDIKSVFFNILLFPKLKINYNNFKSLFKSAKNFIWKEKKLIDNIFLININFLFSFKIFDIFNFRNKKIIKNFSLGLNSNLYLQFTSPVRRIFDVFSNFFIFYAFNNCFNIEIEKWAESLNFIYFYEKFYLLLTIISKRST
nr:exoribonuclease R [Cryptomonas curvata]